MSSATDPQTHAKSYTHYDVLRIGQHEIGNFSKDDIKAAYRRALLLHHPDKTPGVGDNSALNSRSNDAPVSRFSIDDIVIAYETLSDRTKRAEYNESIEHRNRRGWTAGSGQEGTHLGVESCDLEDLAYDESRGVWSKNCRCGDEEGYIVTESDLERESQHGEVYAGCHGCSLFIKVQFAVEAT